MSQTVLRLVDEQNSPENSVRQNAETEFNALAAQNPSQVALHLIEAASSDVLPVDVKQSCLLHLKRLVPKFWSMGFELFIGPPIEQELKQAIRSALINLATTAPVLKIRSGSAYVIVQIAAADYPDEWPDLLTRLYERATDFTNPLSVIGGLAVLDELFDDLISEDLFWEGGVGAQMVGHITGILSQYALLSDVKTAALKLYLTVFNTLLSTLPSDLNERKMSVNEHVVHFSDLLVALVTSLYQTSLQASSLQLEELNFRYYLYRTLTNVIGRFRRFVGPKCKQSLVEILVQDLIYAAKVFVAVEVQGEAVESVKTSDDLDVHQCVTNYVSEIFLVLLILQSDVVIADLLGDRFGVFVDSMFKCSLLPQDTVDEYVGDFNTFVTDVTGLSSKSTVRDAIGDFLLDINDKDATSLFGAIRDQTINTELDWKSKEAYLFLAESLFLNEDTPSLGTDVALSTYLANVNALVSLQGPLNHALVISRIFLLLPRFFEVFSLKLSVNTFGTSEFANTLSYAASSQSVENFELVQAATLISATLWKNILDFNISGLSNDAQVNIFRTCQALLDDSEEDTPPVLLEAISVAIEVDHLFALQANIEDESTVVDLIFKISFKDPANLQLVIDATESLEALLSGIGPDQYLQVCLKLVPFVLEIVGKALVSSKVEYSPDLYLALELLGNIIGAAPGPDSGSFPPEVFLFTFPILRDLILRTNDDQILQSSGEVFNFLLQKASKLFIEYKDPKTEQSGLNVLLEVASKFLSPELSDSAAMNCGLIVISLFENFQPYLDSDFFFQLLQVTVRRLVIAKETITIENLIMVFCKLLLATSPEQLIQALVSVTIDDKGQPKNGLQAVLPIWFNAFEVTRGFEKIKQNVLALGKLYSINDDRVSNMVVDGDLIPYDGDLIVTRSMAKSMPDKYTQIPAPLKIIKLLVGELGFQSARPEAADYLPENLEEEDGNEDWEDMDDIGVPNYDKLKSYVDSDDEDQRDSSDEGIKDVLVQFFRECTAKNLGNFEQYYNMLSDEEKKTVMEAIAF